MDIIDCLILVLLFARYSCCAAVSQRVELSVLHINDFHSRFEETSVDSGLCKNEFCIGGFSRLHSAIKNALQANPDLILLNAGDNFEGTLWYTVYKWKVVVHFFNKLPFDAFTLGNHEFDDGIDGLLPFLDNLNSTVVLANVDSTQEPQFAEMVAKSTVIVRNQRKIGVIGVILATINELVDIGNLTLTEELTAVNQEAERLVNEEDVFTNIILSHCGYSVDKEIARKASPLSKISLIVGAHSHSFLFTGDPVPGPDTAVGPYPTVIKTQDHQTVLVVQAGAYGKYLGNISLNFDLHGEIVGWSGAPIFLAETPPRDNITEEILNWQGEIDRLGGEIIGETLVRLDQNDCGVSECLMGNLVTDSMISAYPGSCGIAVMHAGGLRAGIDIGNITHNEVFSVLPFDNTIDSGHINGEELKQIFEFSVRDDLNLLQVSGLKLKFDLRKPKGERVSSLQINNCQTFEEYESNKNYFIVLPSFLAKGGFNFTSFTANLQQRWIGPKDVDILRSYITLNSPIVRDIEDRIQIVK